MYTVIYCMIQGNFILFCKVSSIAFILFVWGCKRITCYYLQSTRPILNKQPAFTPSSPTLSLVEEKGGETAAFPVDEIANIAGDDELWLTQLDLARAYLEIGHIILAKTILNTICQKGTEIQRKAAEQLLSKISV